MRQLAKSLAIGLALTSLFMCAFSRIADARTHRHYQVQQSWPGYYAQPQVRYIKKKRHVRTEKAKRHRNREMVDANGNSAFAKVTIKNGQQATVIATAQEKFQAFINEVERDKDEIDGTPIEIPIKGNRIADVGCKSGGHMPGSKHAWGGACDFSQLKRSVLSKGQEFLRHVTHIAQRFGLVDGCTWERRRHERFTGPDCGHIEVSGPNYARANQYYRVAMGLRGTEKVYAARRHVHRYRMARR